MKCPFPVVEITWVDAKTYNNEMEIKEVGATAQLATRYAVGYLVFENHDGRTVLAATWDPPDELADITVIPRDWVKDIRHLRKMRSSRKRKEESDGADTKSA